MAAGRQCPAPLFCLAPPNYCISHQLECKYRYPLIIGGIDVPHTRGCVAHSDGDVLLHCITDALLGALCLPDIGQLFPDSDPKWKVIPLRFHQYAKLCYREWGALHRRAWCRAWSACPMAAQCYPESAESSQGHCWRTECCAISNMTADGH